MQRTAVVTGASSGIGAATAVKLAEAGYHVVLAARRADRVEALAGRIRERGGQADAHRLDVTDRAAADALAEYRAGMVVLKELSQILGLFRRAAQRPRAEAQDRLTSPLLDLLVQLRAQLRKEKNFKLSDEIRNKLGGLGVVLEDRPDGTVWRVESSG